MKNISKEFKAGLVAIVVLCLFYWGFSFLKGENIFSTSSKNYYTTYKNVNGLTKSSSVTINGFAVGTVVDIYFDENPKKKGDLIVEFTVEDDLKFSKQSIAKIYSGGLMGGKSLAIVPDYNGAEANPGDYLKGEVESDMISSLGSRLDPIQLKVEKTLTSIDAVAKDVDALLNTEMITNLQGSIQNINQILATLKSTSLTVDQLVAKNQSNLDVTLGNMNKTTENLKVFSDSLTKVKIVGISEKMNRTVASLDKITQGIQAGEGSIGKLTKDENLYNNLENASKELEELLRDMKEHPKRFVHFSLFGKKAKAYKKETSEK